MVISKCFNNDYDETLINAQFDLYFSLVKYFFELPKQRYLKSAGLLKIKTSFVKKLRETSSFDHRVFQPVHDLIAAYYRYNYPKLIEDNQHGPMRLDFDDDNFVPTAFFSEFDRIFPIFPELKDCYQLDLFEKNESLLVCLKKNWIHFFQNEVFHITYTENAFVIASLNAVLKEDEEFINEMLAILHGRYNSDEWLIS
jgi:hypothetical protein